MQALRLKDKYLGEAVPKLKEQMGATNVNRIPRLVKVVVNMGFGVKDKDVCKVHLQELAAITGQKPMITRARQSISNFKLREGMEIGGKVTLRSARMYEFLDRLISAALPRIRDFRGVPQDAFDGAGNFSMGIREQTIFPEIDPNAVTASQGMNVTIVTSAETDDEARQLLVLLGMPFEDKKRVA